jgi:excisionase family DNA binding protein
MTVTETADALGISRNTAYQLVRKGDIPSVRLGRRLVIPKTALNAWLERQADRKHQ